MFGSLSKKLVTVEGQSNHFFISSCSRALALAQCVNNHLFTTGFLSPLWIQDYVELTGVVFGRKNKAPPSAASFLLPALHPPSPSLLIFMDLSANGHRTRHSFRIRHHPSSPSRPLSFSVAPSLINSVWSVPWTLYSRGRGQLTT